MLFHQTERKWKSCINCDGIVSGSMKGLCSPFQSVTGFHPHGRKEKCCKKVRETRETKQNPWCTSTKLCRFPGTVIKKISFASTLSKAFIVMESEWKCIQLLKSTTNLKLGNHQITFFTFGEIAGGVKYLLRKI